jgi:hypothetical protein
VIFYQVMKFRGGPRGLKMRLKRDFHEVIERKMSSTKKRPPAPGLAAQDRAVRSGSRAGP